MQTLISPNAEWRPPDRSVSLPNTRFERTDGATRQGSDAQQCSGPLDWARVGRVLPERNVSSHVIIQLDNITPTGPRNEKFSTCPWRIRKLRRDWHLEQTAAMVPPSVVVKNGMGGRRFSGSFSWSAATERLVNAIPVVINSELFKLSPQVDCV